MAQVSEAADRWRELGFETCRGEEICEDQVTYALLSKTNAEFTVRPLAQHPVIARLVALFGAPARRLLLDPRSSLHRRLAARYNADQTPAHLAISHDDTERVKRRCTLYVSRSRTLAEQARALDRMAADTQGDHTSELGAALGYPPCCVEAYVALERRWPNRLPIAAAAGRSRSFHPRLNNVCLKRFRWIEFFPCRYDCPQALSLADAAAELLAQFNPALVHAIDATLSCPRIYWHDDQQALLRGSVRSGKELRCDALEPLQDAWPLPKARDAVRPEIPIVSRVVLGGKVRFFDDNGPVTFAEPPLCLPFSAADSGR